MLSSRAVLLIGALSVALLIAVAVLGVQLTRPQLEAPLPPAAPPPTYLDLVADLDAVLQEYPAPESATIDDRLALAAVALAARLQAEGDPLALTA